MLTQLTANELENLTDDRTVNNFKSVTLKISPKSGHPGGGLAVF